MPSCNFLVGRTFGNLTVAAFDSVKCNYAKYWRCECICGEEIAVIQHRLLGGQTKSCGCLRRTAPTLRIKHGGAPKLKATPEYSIWAGIIQRCTNPNHSAYNRYGGRGITIFDGWRNDFGAFMRDLGPRPSKRHSVERINNDLGYCPKNCRWATYLEQANNTSVSIKIQIGNDNLTAAQWRRKLGIKYREMSANAMIAVIKYIEARHAECLMPLRVS